MKKFLSIIIISALYIFNLPSAYAEERPSQPRVQESTSAEPENYQANQLIIKFKDSITNNQKEAIFKQCQIEEISSTANGSIALVSLPAKSDVTKMSDLLLSFSQVEFVEPNYQVQASSTPSDYSNPKQWYAKKINMPSAWNMTLGSSDIKVAIIDAGMQTTHPDLRGKITKPYNAITGRTSLPASIHGTHVAGIIAASKNNIGITGIAPNVKIIPVNVFSGEEADIYTVADGIDYAVNAGADIINLSLTTEDDTEVLKYAIQSAINKGVVVVAAVGNDSTSRPQYPAAYKNVIAVSATTKYDKRASFSNYGSYIKLSAPGEDIFSTAPGSSYLTESGTSMATPIVSGISALILSKNPFLKPTEVMNILQKSSIDLGTKGWDRYYGYGRVNAYRALLKTPAPASNITPSSKTFTYTGTNQLSLSLSAKKGTKASLYIKNGNGQIIRRLVTNQVSNGSTFSTKWDGKMDTQAYTPEGKVKVMARVTDGKHTIYRGVYVSVKDKVAPTITLAEQNITFSTTNQQKISVPFHVDKKSRVTAILYDQTGNAVQTLAKEKLVTDGNVTLTWDGQDSSQQQVQKGTYTLQLSITDMNNRIGKTKDLTINVID